MTRPAFTLLELLVVLAVMAIAAAVSAVRLRSSVAERPDEWRSQLVAARRQAIATGVPMSGYFDSVGRFTVFPSGIVVSDSALPEQLAKVTHAR